MSLPIEEIEKLQKTRILKMAEFLMQVYSEDENQVFAKLYKTRTYEFLMKPETDFYWKSKAEILYLLQLELKEEEDEWWAQA